MPVPTPSIIDTRRHQMFPILTPAEIERLQRFGVRRSYGAGEALVTTGEVGPGFAIILSGEVQITQRDASGHREPIVTHGPGAFMGELAQLSGRPALVDAHAQGPVEALIIAPERLRAVLVAEAELGERIMRAPDPAARGPDRGWSRRAGDRRSCRERRCPAAAEFPVPQRPPASSLPAASACRRRPDRAARAIVGVGPAGFAIAATPPEGLGAGARLPRVRRPGRAPRRASRTTWAFQRAFRAWR